MSKSETKSNGEPSIETTGERKFAFFIGCIIPNREQNYEIASRRVCKELGIELVEMDGANCCGLPIDPVNHEMALVLAARNLSMAEKLELNILSLCSGCTGMLTKTNKHLKEDRPLREKINGYLSEIGLDFKGTIEVKHFIRMLIEDFGIENLRTRIKRPLKGIKIAGHYGCHVLMPSKDLKFDDPRDPKYLNELIELTGAEAIRYVDEGDCCGAMVVGVNTELPLHLIRTKLLHMKDADAEAMTTICPSCHLMYDQNQLKAEKKFSEEYGLPVFHFPQLLGLALGIPAEELAIDELKVKTTSLMTKIT